MPKRHQQVGAADAADIIWDATSEFQFVADFDKNFPKSSSSKTKRFNNNRTSWFHHHRRQQNAKSSSSLSSSSPSSEGGRFNNNLEEEIESSSLLCGIDQDDNNNQEQQQPKLKKSKSKSKSIAAALGVEPLPLPSEENEASYPPSSYFDTDVVVATSSCLPIPSILINGIGGGGSSPSRQQKQGKSSSSSSSSPSQRSKKKKTNNTPQKSKLFHQSIPEDVAVDYVDLSEQQQLIMTTTTTTQEEEKTRVLNSELDWIVQQQQQQQQSQSQQQRPMRQSIALALRKEKSERVVKYERVPDPPDITNQEYLNSIPLVDYQQIAESRAVSKVSAWLFDNELLDGMLMEDCGENNNTQKKEEQEQDSISTTTTRTTIPLRRSKSSPSSMNNNNPYSSFPSSNQSVDDSMGSSTTTTSTTTAGLLMTGGNRTRTGSSSVPSQQGFEVNLVSGNAIDTYEAVAQSNMDIYVTKYKSVLQQYLHVYNTKLTEGDMTISIDDVKELIDTIRNINNINNSISYSSNNNNNSDVVHDGAILGTAGTTTADATTTTDAKRTSAGNKKRMRELSTYVLVTKNNNNNDNGEEDALDSDALGSYLANYPKLQNISNARRNMKKCFHEIDYFYEIPLLCARLKDELHSHEEKKSNVDYYDPTALHAVSQDHVEMLVSLAEIEVGLKERMDEDAIQKYSTTNTTTKGGGGAAERRRSSVSISPGAADRRRSSVSISPGAAERRRSSVSFSPGAAERRRSSVSFSPGAVERRRSSVSAAERRRSSVSISSPRQLVIDNEFMIQQRLKNNRKQLKKFLHHRKSVVWDLCDMVRKHILASVSRAFDEALNDNVDDLKAIIDSVELYETANERAQFFPPPPATEPSSSPSAATTRKISIMRPAVLKELYRHFEQRGRRVFHVVYDETKNREDQKAKEARAKEDESTISTITTPNSQITAILSGCHYLTSEIALVQTAIAPIFPPSWTLEMFWTIAVAHICSGRILTLMGGPNGNDLPDMTVTQLLDLVSWVEAFLRDNLEGIMNNMKDHHQQKQEVENMNTEITNDTLMWANDTLWKVHDLVKDEFLLRTKGQTDEWLDNVYISDHVHTQSEDGRLMTSLCEDVYGLAGVQIRTIRERLTHRSEALVQAVGVIIQKLFEKQIACRNTFLEDFETSCAASNDFLRMIEHCEDMLEELINDVDLSPVDVDLLNEQCAVLGGMYSSDAAFAAQKIHLYIFDDVESAIGGELFKERWVEATYNQFALTLVRTVEDFMGDLQVFLDKFMVGKSLEAIVKATVIFYVKCIIRRSTRFRSSKAGIWTYNHRALDRMRGDITVMRQYYEGLTTTYPSLSRTIESEFQILDTIHELFMIAAGLSRSDERDFIILLQKHIKESTITKYVVGDLWHLVEPAKEASIYELIDSMEDELLAVAPNDEEATRSVLARQTVPGLRLDMELAKLIDESKKKRRRPGIQISTSEKGEIMIRKWKRTWEKQVKKFDEDGLLNTVDAMIPDFPTTSPKKLAKTSFKLAKKTSTRSLKYAKKGGKIIVKNVAQRFGY